MKEIGNFTLPTYGNKHGLRRNPAPRHHGDTPDDDANFVIFANYNPHHSGRGEALTFYTKKGFSSDLSPIAARPEFGTAKTLFPEFFEKARPTSSHARAVEFDADGNIVGEED